MKRKVAVGLVVIFILMAVLFIIATKHNKKEEVDNNTYLTDSDYLYEKVLEDIKSKDTKADETINQDKRYNGTKDIKRFYTYEPLGIVLKDGHKEVYLRVATGKYYLLDKKIYQDTTSNIVYSYRFLDDDIVNVSNNGLYEDKVPKKIKEINAKIDTTEMVKKIEDQVKAYYSEVSDKTINTYDENR